SQVLDPDTGNLRAGLRFLLDRRPHDALRMCAVLVPFWLRRIELEEARRRLDEALAACPDQSSLAADVLLAAAAIEFRSGALGAVAWVAGELETADSLVARSVALLLTVENSSCVSTPSGRWCTQVRSSIRRPCRATCCARSAAGRPSPPTRSRRSST